MESLDSRDAVLELILALLAEEEFRAGPSAGVVLQAYLRDSPATLDTIVEWISGAGAQRAHPLTVRLVKGAYWDHEIVEAVQHGWQPPVFEVKADSDLNFELLTRGLIDHHAEGCGLRPAIASHNLRSVSHAIAYNRLTGGEDADIEMQILRGLGDPLQDGDRRPGPARARLLPGRRPRGRHGLPRAAAAREHEQRLVPAGAGARRGDLASCWPSRSRRRREGVHERADPRAAAGADPRAARRRAGGARRAAPVRVPVWVGDERARGRRADLHRPRRARPRGGRGGLGDAGRGRGRARAGRHGRAHVGGDAGGASAPRSCSPPPTGCGSGGSRSPRSRSARRPSRGRRPTPTSARRSTSSSTTRAARSTSRRARRCSRCRASATSCATRRAASSR